MQTNLGSSIEKLIHRFNALPATIMNPLLTGVFLVGTSMGFVNPSTLFYLAFLVAASTGVYTVMKPLIPQHLPTWVIQSMCVAATFIYLTAGLPGIFLAIGLGAGWYLHEQLIQGYQEWKNRFQEFAREFQANPIYTSLSLLSRGLQFVIDKILVALLPKEESPAETAVVSPPAEPSVAPEPSIAAAPTILLRTPEPLIFSQVEARPEMQSRSITPRTSEIRLDKEISPLPKLPEIAPLCSIASQAQRAPASPIRSIAPAIPAVELPKEAAISVIHPLTKKEYPLLMNTKKEICVGPDSPEYHGFFGGVRLFFHTLDPRAEVVVKSGPRIR